MSKIKKVYDEIYSDNQNREPRLFIEFYELNKDLIEGADHSLSNPDYEGITRITADYAISLSRYGYSRKAIPYLDKAIELFKNSSSGYLTAIPMYEVLILTRGIENYNGKNYSLATMDFKYLVDQYPENDKYKNWLVSSRTIRIRKYLNILWPVTLLGMMFDTVINKQSAGIKSYLFIISTVLFISVVIIEIIIFAIKREIKK